jgi:hypothetical protein
MYACILGNYALGNACLNFPWNQQAVYELEISRSYWANVGQLEKDHKRLRSVHRTSPFASPVPYSDAAFRDACLLNKTRLILYFAEHRSKFQLALHKAHFYQGSERSDSRQQATDLKRERAWLVFCKFPVRLSIIALTVLTGFSRDFLMLSWKIPIQ